MTRLLTPSEVAEILGQSTKTLANWRSSSLGPPYVKLGSQVRYDEHELAEWVTARRQPGDGTVTVGSLTRASRRKSA